MLLMLAAQASPVDLHALSEVLHDLQAHQWVPLAAILVGLVVALTKQGWFGRFVATRIPAALRPALAMVLATIGAVATRLQQGEDLPHALLDALYATALAVLGHQVLVEGIRSGRELLGPAPWVKQPPSNDAAPPAKAA